MIALLLAATLTVAAPSTAASSPAAPTSAVPLSHPAVPLSHTTVFPSPAAPSSDTLSAVVHGRVWSAHTGAPLAHAVIELRLAGSPRYAVTDETGSYHLEQVPPGQHVLRALALDHAPLEVSARVTGGNRVELDLTLEVRPIGLPPLLAAVIVDGSEGQPGAHPPLRREREVRETELRALEASPGMAELGLGEAGGAPPGVGEDPSSLLYVRGAASDLKLVLLDGAPVYAPFHLGGLLDAFQPGVLRSARLWVGGAPARFDGGLSYVLDLRTRSGASDRVRTAGAADLMGARSQVEGPLGPGTFLAGGRAVHGALHEGLTGDPLPYGYADGLLRLDLPLGAVSGISGTGFWNRETVSLEAVDGIQDPAYWGNAAGSLRWHGPLGEGKLELLAATGDFATRLPMGGDSPRIAEGNSRRSRVQALYGQRAGPIDLDAGLAFEHLSVALRSGPVPGGLASTSGTTVPGSSDPRNEVEEGEAAGSVLGVFADASWSPIEELELRGGFRTDAFMTEHRLRIAPRVGASWHASEQTTLSVAAGRFHQYVRAPETVLSADLDGWPVLEEPATDVSDADADLSSGALLAVVGASHLVVGLENRLREDLSLGLEAFLKTFDGLEAVEGLHASGADVWLHRAGEHWNAWLGYSIAWAWTSRLEDGPTARFAGRHLVSGGLGSYLVSGVELDVEVSYGAGLPFTPIPRTPEASVASLAYRPQLARSAPEEEAGDPTLSGAPKGSYLRLDARVSRSWSGRLHGMGFELTPYLKLLNALDRRDALFYHFDPERDLRPRSLAAVPLLPVVGLEWRI